MAIFELFNENVYSEVLWMIASQTWHTSQYLVYGVIMTGSEEALNESIALSNFETII